MSASASFISSIDSSRNCCASRLVAPVVAHLGVDEVLVDRRELGGEHLVEQFDDGRIALHATRVAMLRVQSYGGSPHRCVSAPRVGPVRVRRARGRASTRSPVHGGGGCVRAAPRAPANILRTRSRRRSVRPAPRPWTRHAPTSPSMVRSVTARQWHTYTSPRLGQPALMVKGALRGDRSPNASGAFTDTMPIPFALGGITVLLDATLLAAPSRRHGFQP